MTDDIPEQDDASTTEPPAEFLAEETDPRLLHRISVCGWSLCALWAAVLVTWGILQPDPYAQGWRLVIELMFLGRAVNVVHGLSAGFSKTYLLVQSGPQDIILLLVLYPWVVRGYERTVRRRLLRHFFARLNGAAERHKDRVGAFGALGLWAFVFFPFWSTGALVGGVVGYLLGMRTSVIFTSVFLGHGLSTVGLIWFFHGMEQLTALFNEGWAKYIAWIVLAALFAASITCRMLRNRLQARREGSPPAPSSRT